MRNNISPKGFKNLTEKDRSVLRIIVDTVSSSKQIYNGISKTIKYCDNRDLFEDIQIIVPLQNGTEITQKIFPEFLQRDLALGGDTGLHGFYKRYADTINVVNTPDSDSYRYFFAHSAMKFLSNNEYLKKQVAEDAAEFWKEYYPEKKPHTPEFYEKKFEKMKNDFFKTFDENFTKNFGLETGNVTFKEFSKINEKLGHRKDVEDSREVQGKEYFKDMKMSHKVLLQAMYSNYDVFMETRKNREFMRYEEDRGERSIESHLFKSKLSDKAKYLYMVVTDDSATRDSIHSLRQKTSSTIYVLSSVGVATSLKFLGIVQDEAKVAPEYLIKKAEKLSEEYKAVEEEYKATGKGRAIDPDNILNPKKETEKAIELACIIKWGKYPGEKPKAMELQ